MKERYQTKNTGKKRKFGRGNGGYLTLKDENITPLEFTAIELPAPLDEPLPAEKENLETLNNFSLEDNYSLENDITLEESSNDTETLYLENETEEESNEDSAEVLEESNEELTEESNEEFEEDTSEEPDSMACVNGNGYEADGEIVDDSTDVDEESDDSKFQIEECAFDNHLESTEKEFTPTISDTIYLNEDGETDLPELQFTKPEEDSDEEENFGEKLDEELDEKLDEELDEKLDEELDKAFTIDQDEELLEEESDDVLAEESNEDLVGKPDEELELEVEESDEPDSPPCAKGGAYEVGVGIVDNATDLEKTDDLQEEKTSDSSPVYTQEELINMAVQLALKQREAEEAARMAAFEQEAELRRQKAVQDALSAREAQEIENKRRQAEEDEKMRLREMEEQQMRNQIENERRLAEIENIRQRKALEEALRLQQEAMQAKQLELEQKEKELQEMRLKAEEETRRQAEEEARRQAEEEARRQAEEEARRQAEEEARRQAEEEARRQAEEEARRQAEEEARRQAEEARLRQINDYLQVSESDYDDYDCPTQNAYGGRNSYDKENEYEYAKQNEYEEDTDYSDENMYETNIAKIKVIGVGGAGSNAVNRMIELGVDTAEFVAVNTDKQDLMLSLCDEQNKIQIGSNVTKGLGAGADPALGEQSAEESKKAIEEAVKGVDLLFIAAGMGGGTGTGAAPIVAKIAKDAGCVTVAVVTRPFHFEGKKRELNAKKGISNLAKYVDTIIIIPNDRLLEALPADTPFVEALKYADDTLRQGICGIADLIATPSLINLDFADVRTILKNQGLAHMGVGKAKGENRVIEAVRQAVASPLLETTIEGAHGIILNVTGGKDLSMSQVKEAADRIQEIIDPTANIIFGMNVNPELQEEIIITIIATGFDKKVDEDSVAPTQKPSMPFSQTFKSGFNTSKQNNFDVNNGLNADANNANNGEFMSFNRNRFGNPDAFSEDKEKIADEQRFSNGYGENGYRFVERNGNENQDSNERDFNDENANNWQNLNRDSKPYESDWRNQNSPYGNQGGQPYGNQGGQYYESDWQNQNNSYGNQNGRKFDKPSVGQNNDSPNEKPKKGGLPSFIDRIFGKK